ncbi:MAG: DUF1887 family protein [Rhodospirillaceae bacterium]|nr:DUF1887 family protein [Rhodospirillaceae bacterium]
MKYLKQLLAGRGVTLMGEPSPEQVGRVRAWFPHARFLAENFTEFDHVRRGLMHQARNAGHGAHIRAYLEKAGLLLPQRGTPRPVSHDADMFLRGEWLEEYVWMAFVNAGADAVTFHQSIHWRVDEFEGDNEIDVIARIGDRLAFVSCKAMKPQPNASGSQNYRGALINFLNEIDNAQDQYGYPWDSAFLFTTTAFQDDDGQTRYGSILGKARALDVYVLGLEDLSWRRLLPYMTKVVQDLRSDVVPMLEHPVHGFGAKRS